MARARRRRAGKRLRRGLRACRIDHRRRRVPDLNGDGNVDGVDLGTLLGTWGAAGIADLTRDGTVDGIDLGVLLGSWGACP